MTNVHNRRRPAEVGDALDHFVNGLDWLVPEVVVLEGGRLVSRLMPRPTRRVRAGPGLLEDFLGLARGRDERVLAYAKRWGPLWLCEHGEPWRNHQPDC